MTFPSFYDYDCCIAIVFLRHHPCIVVSSHVIIKGGLFQFVMESSFIFFILHPKFPSFSLRLAVRGQHFWQGRIWRNLGANNTLDSMPTLEYPKLIMSSSCHIIFGSAGKDISPPASSPVIFPPKIVQPRFHFAWPEFRPDTIYRPTRPEPAGIGFRFNSLMR